MYRLLLQSVIYDSLPFFLYLLLRLPNEQQPSQSDELSSSLSQGEVEPVSSKEVEELSTVTAVKENVTDHKVRSDCCYIQYDGLTLPL